MVKITQKRLVCNDITLNDSETLEVVNHYIQSVLGDGCYINRKGRLEHWTSFPHGSGTTTDMGEPSPLQLAVWELSKLLSSMHHKNDQ